MGLNKGNKVFSTDILRVEVSGPSQPHLVCKPSLVPFLSPGYLGCCSTPRGNGLTRELRPIYSENLFD
jgi:hypothetical protein